MLVAPISPQAPARKRITVMQGMVEVSNDPNVVLTTILGSCIAGCLYDPVARVGAMNHFLLAEPLRQDSSSKGDSHYGIYLMEMLVNAMLKMGAAKQRMRAHIYGGGNIHRNMQQIGTANSLLAERFLKAEGIEISHQDTGGTIARRVDFLAASGKTRCRRVEDAAAPPAKPIEVQNRSVGDVEFF